MNYLGSIDNPKSLINREYINDIVANEYDSTETYSVGDYVIYNGDYWVCKIAIETSELWNESKWTKTLVGKELTNVKQDFTRYYESGANAVDILSIIPEFPLRLRNGITIEPEGSGSYHVYGTSTEELTAFSFWDRPIQLPPAMHAGNLYRVKYATDNTSLVFRVYVYYAENPSPVYLTGGTVDMTFTIPNDAVGLILQLAVVGTDVTVDSVVRPQVFTEALTNEELTNKGFPAFEGFIDSGSGAVDILSLIHVERVRSRYGITIEPVGNNGYHVYGVATQANVAFAMWDRKTEFPLGMHPGNTYRVKYTTDNPSLVFRVYVYNGPDSSAVYLKGFNSDGEFTLPDDCTGVNLQLCARDADVTYDSTVVPHAFTTLTNDELNVKIEKTVDDIDGYLGTTLKPYNAVNAVADTFEFRSEIVSGVTFAWDNGVCTVNGQATGIVVNILRSQADIPAVYERGKFCRTTFHTSDDAVSLRIMFRDSVGDLITTTYVREDTYVLIPENAERWSMGLYITDTTHVFSNVTVSDIAILSAESNDALVYNNSNRYYNYQDMRHGYFYNLNLDILYFRDAERLQADSTLSCMLIPVRKGDSVFLSTYGGVTNAKSFCIIPYDRIISYIETSRSVSKTIQIETDGWLAINCANSHSSEFFCKVESTYNKAPTFALFADALVSDDYSQWPVYDDDNPCRVLRHGSTLAGMIQHWGIIGASSDCGEVNYTVAGESSYRELELYDYSPWSHWKRMNGIADMYHYCDGGQNAKEWFTLGPNTTRGWAYTNPNSTLQNPEVNGVWSGRSAVGIGGGCWWKMKADHENGDTKQAFIITLGGNDLNNNNPHDENWNEYPEGEYDTSRYYKCGTIEDIGTYDLTTDTDTPPAGKQAGVIPGVVNSFAAYYGAVLNRILAIQPDAKIFCSTIRNNKSGSLNEYQLWQQYNDVIRQIVAMDQYENNVYLLDYAKWGPNSKCLPLIRMFTGNHYDVMGYKFVASYYNTIIDYIIQSHYTEFKQTMFIGTNMRI